MSMTTATLVPVDEYLATSYEPDREYVDGQLLERNVGEHDHSLLQTILAAYFYALGKRLPIRTFTEQRVQIVSEAGRHRYRIPDISVVLKPYRRQPVLTEPPLAAIEILSEDDTVTSILDRLEDYRLFGIPHIWVIDPAVRRTYRLEQRQQSSALQEVSSRRMRIPELDLEVDFNELFLDLDSD